MGVDVASFGDAHAHHRRRARGGAQRRRQGHLRQARGLRRREDPARRHPRRRRVRLRVAAPAGRPPAARRPGRADLPGRRRSSAPAPCPTTPRSAPATTSARAPSAARSPTAPATSRSVKVLHQRRNVLRRLRADDQAAARPVRRRRCRRRCASTSSQSRAELFEIVAATGIRTFSASDRQVRQRLRLRHLQADGRVDPGVDATREHILRRRAGVAAGHQRPLPGQHADATAPTRWCRGCRAASARRSS